MGYQNTYYFIFNFNRLFLFVCFCSEILDIAILQIDFMRQYTREDCDSINTKNSGLAVVCARVTQKVDAPFGFFLTIKDQSGQLRVEIHDQEQQQQIQAGDCALFLFDCAKRPFEPEVCFDHFQLFYGFSGSPQFRRNSSHLRSTNCDSFARSAINSKLHLYFFSIFKL